MNSDQQARELLSRVMSIPFESIDSSVRIGATKQWDSLTHMNLILSIEEAVGRRLHPSEYLEIEDFDSLKAFFDTLST